jgi:hypothetical protein
MSESKNSSVADVEKYFCNTDGSISSTDIFLNRTGFIYLVLMQMKNELFYGEIKENDLPEPGIELGLFA